MPNVSERQRALNQVEDAMKMAFMDAVVRDDDWSDSDVDHNSVSSNDDDDTIQTLGTLHLLISSNRFLNPRRTIAKSRDYVLNYFLDQPDDQFRKITRVSRDTFNHIVDLIWFDPIFHNVSTCPQAPVHWQLACALDRLGNNGQGVSHAHSKLIWGIGQGIIHLYTRRVVKALWALRDLFISWPSDAEQAQTSRRMEAKGFKNCVGFVDGTTFPIHKKPSIYGNIYMDRKKRYSVNGQVVCDDQYRILFFMCGQPGSTGDSRVFSNSILAREPHECFAPRQYLLSDSAYAATETVVPSYKDNQRDDPNDPNDPHEWRKIDKFNTFLAKARVVNEHTIEILKGHWSSLRGMRVDLHEREDMQSFIKQTTVCVILHNLCLNRDPWGEEVLDEPEDEDDEEVLQPMRRVRILTAGQRRRWEVRKACLAFHSVD